MTVTAVTTKSQWPIGKWRVARRLSDRVGREITPDDVSDMINDGLLAPVGEFNGYDTFDVDVVDQIDTSLIDERLEERDQWIARSQSVSEAASLLGVPAVALGKAVAAAGLRYPAGERVPAGLADAILANDHGDASDLAATARLVRARLQVAGGRAAAWLGIRRTDFDHLVRAGMITASSTTMVQVSHRRTVDVELFSVADLDRALDDPRVPWPGLREVGPGDRSPLLSLLDAPSPNRPKALREWASQAEQDFGVGFLVEWDRWRQQWCAAWDTYTSVPPTAEQVAQHLADNQRAGDAGLGPTNVKLGDPTIATVWWARHMLQPGVAVILDTETTSLDDPEIVEIAVVDAATGRTRLQTLVNAQTEIEPGARAVHGIGAADLVDAPTWPEVLPRLRRATRGRTVLAWNAGFDLRAVANTTLRQPQLRHVGHLAQSSSWQCLMEAQMERTGTWSFIPLNGPHSAVGDCGATRDRLVSLAAM